MNEVITYMLQSAVSITIFYVFYMMVFRKEGYFGFNRYYLLIAVVVSVLLPLVQFNLGGMISGNQGNIITISPVHDLVTFSLDEIVIYGNGDISATNANPNSWMSVLSLSLMVYIVGVILASLLLIFKLFRIMSIVNSSEKVKKNGLVYVITKKGTPAFSFLNYVFIDEGLFISRLETEKIIEHELAHVKNHHSYDLLFLEIIQVIQWYNPVVYLLKKMIRENHEFMADNEVVASYDEPLAYGKLLIDHSSPEKTISIAHNFSYSLLKRRLSMITLTKNPIRFSFKLIWVLVAINLVFFACSEPDKDVIRDIPNEEVFSTEITPTEVKEVAIAKEETEINGEVFTVVEVMPEYPGGIEALMTYLSDNIKYPEKAKANDVEGRVFLNFVVTDRGEVKNVKVLRGIDDECDKEAVRVVSNMPNWTPGTQRGIPVNVSYNIPIRFTISSDDKDGEIYDFVEEMPKYPGGEKEMISYLANSIKYPAFAKKNGVSGRVFVSFIVEKDGSVDGVKILRGIGAGCDKEAMRVVKAMPNWIPGKNEKGEAVRVKFNIPINFALQ